MDPTQVDENSGVRHDDVFPVEDAQAILDAVWGPMHEHGAHLANRPFETDGVTEGIVIVACGEAARLLQEFCRNKIPSADGSPAPGAQE